MLEKIEINMTVCKYQKIEKSTTKNNIFRG